MRILKGYTLSLTLLYSFYSSRLFLTILSLLNKDNLNDIIDDLALLEL